MKVSQREARRLRKQVAAFEKAEHDRRYAWAKEWPGGTDIGRTQLGGESKLLGSILTARKLNHAVVAVADTDGTVYFMALPL